LFFCAALLAKEMAMSLPFIVLFFAFYYWWKNRVNIKAIKILFVVPYFAILAGYFWLRYRATGLFFGYYGTEHLHLGFNKIAAVYSDLIISFVLSDQARTVFSLWLNDNSAIILAVAILFLTGLLYLTWKKKWPAWPWLIFLSLGVSLVPVASFGINLTKDYFSEEGERYGYLPSIFGAMMLAAGIIARWKRINKIYCKIAFPIIIILIAAGLAGQLLVKNWRFEQAGIVAKQALEGAVEQMEQENYLGVLFFGIPDNFHGAPIFRNGWKQAIAFYLVKPPIILAPFNRTAYEAGQKFTVDRTGGNHYDYASADGSKTILAKPKFSSEDYSTALKDYIFDPAGINDRYFGSALDIGLSVNLAGNDQVALFFWNGGGWEILSAKQ
jgi:hypothetical protein